MKWFLVLIFTIISFNAFSQEDIIAQEYYKNGAFEKALIAYKILHKKNPNNLNYFLQLIKTHRQLEQYDDAEIILFKKSHWFKSRPTLYVDLGYNYQLKKDTIQAEKNYNNAISSISENPNYAYSVGKSFENYSLLNYAVTTYSKAMEIKPDIDFNMNLARIYGEQGKVEKMLSSYLDLVENNPNYLPSIKRAITDFIDEDSNHKNNKTLRKILLLKIQKSPDILWNSILSWLFVQQKDYKKSFLQEKAIFKRTFGNIGQIDALAQIALDNNKIEIAKEILEFLITNAQNKEIAITSHYKILKIDEQAAKKDNYNAIKNKYQDLLETFGINAQTLTLQIAYAHFVAFYLNDPESASSFLKQALNTPLTLHQKAEIKLELGDILVLQERFNEALIYFTQIQRNLKNSTLSQKARFKVAQTSYFKGDFKWAESQLEILKSSTSQLIANDALELKLLISDNKYEDSLQTALKLYAKADLFAFQNKTQKAITVLDSILKHHGNESITDQTLLKQARLLEQKKEFEKAKNNYTLIIDNYSDDILADDAYFSLAELYVNHLNLPEAAKPLYEQILFNYQDSIYFVESRKKYRRLRGDLIN